MKINWKIRLTNPHFWLGLIMTVLAAAQIEPASLTSWELLWQSFRDLACNPFALGCVAVAVMEQLVDKTTPGLGDSPRALSRKRLGDE